jgi:hypothetical protein
MNGIAGDNDSVLLSTDNDAGCFNAGDMVINNMCSKCVT